MLIDELLRLDDEINRSPYAEPLQPYIARVDTKYFERFVHEYYAVPGQRTLVLGINPGRKGSGLTGVPFTDGRSLAEDCGIENEFRDARELTSQFLYQVVRSAGEVHSFFSHLCLSGIFPACLVADGRNANYYDLIEGEALRGLVAHSLQIHRDLPDIADRLVVIGQGRHLDLISAANDRHGFFKEITALPHPRYIMQYNRARADDFIRRYVDVFELH